MSEENQSNIEYWRGYDFDVQTSGEARDCVARNYEGQWEKNGKYDYIKPGQMFLYVPLTKPPMLAVCEAHVVGEISFVGANILATFVNGTEDKTRGIFASKHAIPLRENFEEDFAMYLYQKRIAPFHNDVHDRFENDKYSFGLIKNWTRFYEVMLWKLMLCDTKIWRPELFKLWEDTFKNYPAQNDKEISKNGFTDAVKKHVGLNTYYLMTAYSPEHDPDNTPAIRNIRKAFCRDYSIPFEHISGDFKLEVSMKEKMAKDIENHVFCSMKREMMDWNHEMSRRGSLDAIVQIPSFFDPFDAETGNYKHKERIHVPTEEELGYKYT